MLHLMKNNHTAWLIGMLLMGLCTSGSEALAEWYVGGDIGGVFPKSLSNIEGTGTSSGTPATGTRFNDLKTSAGASVGLKVGHYFPSIPWLGLEGNFQVSSFKIKDQAFNGTGPTPVTSTISEGTARVLAPSLNLMVRYPGERFQPYAGIGPALAVIKTIKDGGTSANVGVNIMAGARFFLEKDVSLFTEFQYLRTTFEADHAINPTFGVKGDYSASHLLVGLSWHFERN
jgi:opacity protein-like surface antigen